jgi:pimeloyl-ACP methyl ester carboxylesterase
MLNYSEAGKGPVIVLLHGFPLNRSIWAQQAAHLANRYRVITPDLPGHGGSEPFPEGGPATMSRMAREVLALLDHLKVGQFAVAGHSMGGYVALALQQHAPDRVLGLGLISTQARPDSPEAREGRLNTAAKVHMNGAGVVAEAMAPKLFGPSITDEDPRYRATVGMMQETPVAGVRGALLGMAERADMRECLTGIMVPSLVLVGTDDKVIPLERSQCMAVNIPHAVLVKVPGAGHMPMIEDPAAMNEALEQWLELVF